MAIQQIVNLWAIYIYVVENCFWHIKSENYINQLLHSTKAKHEKKKTHLQPELLLLLELEKHFNVQDQERHGKGNLNLNVS